MQESIVETNHFLPHLGNVLAEALKRKPDAVLGVAGGLTTYKGLQSLRNLVLAGDISLARVRLFPAEIVIGMPRDHSLSFGSLVRRFLLPDTDLPAHQIIEIEDASADEHELKLRFERRLAELGGINIALLGVGTNGHVAAIEPADTLPMDCFIAELSDETVQHAPPELQSVGRRLVTVGMGTLFQANEIIIAANGPSKARAISRARQGAMDPHCPLSILLAHQGCHLVLDHEAASSATQAAV